MTSRNNKKRKQALHKPIQPPMSPEVKVAVAAKPEPKPVYKHSCSNCKFVITAYSSSVDRWGDVYLCLDKTEPENDLAVFRFSDNSTIEAAHPRDVDDATRMVDWYQSVIEKVESEAATITAADVPPLNVISTNA